MNHYYHWEQTDFYNHISGLLLEIEEIVIPEIIDDRQWLPLWYGGRFGFLPYRNEAEKQALLNDERFFGANYISQTAGELIKEDKKKKDTDFKLDLGII